MPIYLVDIASSQRPVRIQAKSLSQLSVYCDEQRWRVKSVRYESERGNLENVVDSVIRDDWKPKNVATKIELTVGQIVIGLVLTVVFIGGLSLLFGLGLGAYEYFYN
ncbi:MAG: hypothetical protein ED559_10885 [Phycisphaera sp.]|nr:MAG: hypothetical protein ED559_10885 [Phycisphaera sp.]